MKPYSKDLRLRVLAAVDRGVPREEVARTFSVSVPTIKRWLKRRRRETGDVEPRPIPGRPRLKGAALQEWLPSQLQENNDLTLEEHREVFEEICSKVVDRGFLEERGVPSPVTWKKRRHTDAKDTPRR